jgi:hypothetical protein
MKKLLISAALMIGTAAVAQQPSGRTVDDQSQSTGPRGITQQGTDPEGMGVAPPGTNEPVNVVPGAQVVLNPNQAAAFATQASTTDYPACSKTVTDGCVQTYERGTRPRSRRR